MDKLIYTIAFVIDSSAGTWTRLDMLNILLAYIHIGGASKYIISS